MYIRTHARTHACMYVCTYLRMYVCMHVCMYVCVLVCMHICLYVSMCAYMYVCMYVCIYAYMYVCVYVGVYASVCVCMYVTYFTYVCLYVCIHVCCMRFLSYVCFLLVSIQVSLEDNLRSLLSKLLKFRRIPTKMSSSTFSKHFKWQEKILPVDVFTWVIKIRIPKKICLFDSHNFRTQEQNLAVAMSRSESKTCIALIRNVALILLHSSWFNPF
jgi:hypothetical protein